MKQKGFTVIELLIVIAIIGFLASMVLITISIARAKAKDARIRTNIQQMKILAEAAASDAGVYKLVDITTPGSPGLTLDKDISDHGGKLYQEIAPDNSSYCASSGVPSGLVGVNLDTKIIPTALAATSTGGETTTTHLMSPFFCLDTNGGSSTAHLCNSATGLCTLKTEAISHDQGN